jgi:tetratricopeptide (TPR) repeat protein
LFEEAGKKYAEALRIKPDKHDGFNNWGAALLAQAKQKGASPDADRLFEEAGKKYAEALRIKPDKHEAFYNLARLASLRDRVSECLDALRKWKDLDERASGNQLDRESDFDNVRGNSEFEAFRASLLT